METFEREQLRRKAQGAVQKEIQKGNLEKLDGAVSCVDCGDPATCYDHRNYFKPLEVEPVCTRCNSLRGAAIPIPDDYKQHRAGKRDGGFEEPASFDGRCLVNIDHLDFNQRFFDDTVKIAMDELMKIPPVKRHKTRKVKYINGKEYHFKWKWSKFKNAPAWELAA